jgi:hypothetical protein
VETLIGTLPLKVSGPNIYLSSLRGGVYGFKRTSSVLKKDGGGGGGGKEGGIKLLLETETGLLIIKYITKIKLKKTKTIVTFSTHMTPGGHFLILSQKYKYI